MICLELTVESEAFLEIAAMATVCDVMPLCDENRIIVKEGLRRIQHTNITGLQALIEANHLEEKRYLLITLDLFSVRVLMLPVV